MNARRVYFQYAAGALTLFLIAVSMIRRQWPDAYLHVVMCDVGQGDAVLIWQGFTQVLIDAGKDHKAAECVARYLPFWDKTLELVVATHADSDHIGGFELVGERYQFLNILSEPLGKETEVFAGFSELLSRQQRQGSQLILPQLHTELLIADAFTFTILSR